MIMTLNGTGFITPFSNVRISQKEVPTFEIVDVLLAQMLEGKTCIIATTVGATENVG